jgi:hypothetical protein
MREKPHLEIAKAIDAMRDNVRGIHIDVRNNSRVLATMWDFCRVFVGGLEKDPEYTGESSK